MRVARGRAVGNHGDRKIGRVRRSVDHLDVEHRGQAAQSLRADAETVDLVVEFDAQLFGGGFGAACDQVLNVDGIHERLLGEEHRFLRRAADADAEHAGRAPAGAHRGHGLEHPLHHGVGWVQHGELALGLGAASLGGHGDFDRRAFHEFHSNAGGSVVLCVLAGAGGVGLERGAQLVVGIEIGAAHAFVDHLLKVKGLFAGGRFKAHIHAHFDEDVDDAGVLADGAVALGAHAAVDENLRHGVFGGVRLLALVGLGEARDVVDWVVVADVLQRARNAGDEIFLADDGHEPGSPRTL